jgi:hypothetical protein
LKYFYSGQNFDSIKEEITNQNIFALYAQAYALKADKLIEDITEFEISDLMGPDEVVHIYHDAIEFENQKLQRACEKMITKSFSDCLEY